MPAILQCPFCGSDDIMIDFKCPVYRGDGREFFAHCQDCDCDGPPSKEPIDAWNRRADTKGGANLQHTTERVQNAE